MKTKRLHRCANPTCPNQNARRWTLCPACAAESLRWDAVIWKDDQTEDTAKVVAETQTNS